ncbi:uncharacterized protein ATNIH1004_003111 [Aspergillus tanneri]|uniref:RNase H type-1 domain-containing protein n=1 Tax=Aspergillus tanneri TaxID=1220188 RepID=A0A5M9MTL8_9EURO|nr:uncharacterized protein ATNIH1004_003111 [Aspergillus tanneri]KAA8650425.1 hypothetical protein ATNIH1004_003111 [Aspergillus tanneri]
MEPWRAPPDVVIEDCAEARKSHDQILQQTNKPLSVFIDETTTTVYAAELRGVQMGLEIVKRCHGMQRWRSYIRSPESAQATSASLWTGDPTGMLVAAPLGVSGNEATDRLVKQAAQRGPLRGQQLVMLQSADKRRIRAESKAKWAKAWQRTRTGRPTKRLINAPEKGVLRYWEVSERQPAHRINVRESALRLRS